MATALLVNDTSQDFNWKTTGTIQTGTVGAKSSTDIPWDGVAYLIVAAVNGDAILYAKPSTGYGLELQIGGAVRTMVEAEADVVLVTTNSILLSNSSPRDVGAAVLKTGDEKFLTLSASIGSDQVGLTADLIAVVFREFNSGDIHVSGPAATLPVNTIVQMAATDLNSAVDLGPPFFVNLGDMPDRSFRISWAGISGVATAYNISRSTTSGGGYGQIGSVAGDATFYDDGWGSLPPDTTYYYVVHGVNGMGRGPDSNEVSGTTGIRLIGVGVG